MVLVSACLAGLNTRYNGTNCGHPEIIKLVAAGKAIPLCPEQLGGLPTPRPVISFVNGDGNELIKGTTRVMAIDIDGNDYSQNLLRGANEVLRIVKMFNMKQAILKEGSPSCGVFKVWVYPVRSLLDYSCFQIDKKKLLKILRTSNGVNSQKIEGCGVTTAILKANGIEVESIDL